MSQNISFPNVQAWPRYAALILSLACFAGCPDYSHLRPEPDYINMTDSGGESGEPKPEVRKP